MQRILNTLRKMLIPIGLAACSYAHAAPDCSNLKLDDVMREEKSGVPIIFHYKFSGICLFSMQTGYNKIQVPINVKVTGQSQTIKSLAPPFKYINYSSEEATLTVGTKTHKIKSMQTCSGGEDPFRLTDNPTCKTSAINGSDLSSLGLPFLDPLTTNDTPLAKSRAGGADTLLAQKKAAADKIANMKESVTPDLLSPKQGDHFKKGGVLKIKAILPPHPAWQRCCDVDFVRADDSSKRTTFTKEQLDGGNELNLDVTQLMQAFENHVGLYSMCVTVFIDPAWGQTILYGKPSQCINIYMDAGTQNADLSGASVYKTKPQIVSPAAGSMQGDKFILHAQLPEELKADGMVCCNYKLQEKTVGGWADVNPGGYATEAAGSVSGLTIDISSWPSHEYRIQVTAQTLNATLAPSPSDWVEFKKLRKAIKFAAEPLALAYPNASQVFESNAAVGFKINFPAVYKTEYGLSCCELTVEYQVGGVWQPHSVFIAGESSSSPPGTYKSGKYRVRAHAIKPIRVIDPTDYSAWVEFSVAALPLAPPPFPPSGKPGGKPGGRAVQFAPALGKPVNK